MEGAAETVLLRRLFESGHLSVPDRRRLPGQVVRASVARRMILADLIRIGWFPHDGALQRGDAGGEYVQVELAGTGAGIVHQNCETSFARFTHRAREFPRASQAVDEYLRLVDGRLDGVRIDWAA